ncbi:MAG: hypothetical protein ACI8RZ_000992 [Myxococcota bacterium]|jgi:hypothetical protein
MEEMSSGFAALRSAMFSLPFLLLWIGGLVMAVLQRDRHPRAALLTGIACGLLLLTELLTTGLFMIISVLELWSLMGIPMTIITLLSNLMFAVGLGLLVAAVWSGRPAHG